jgi:LysM repeat protein
MDTMTNRPANRYSPYRRPAKRRPAPKTRQVNNWLIFLAKAALILGVLALLALPALIAAGTYAYFQIFERIVPGVRVGETRLGGMTVYDAAVVLNERWNLERNIAVGAVVDGEVRTWPLSPAQLGLWVDPVETAQHAFAVGHHQDAFSEADQMLASVFKGREVSLAVKFDEAAARDGLERLSQQAGKPPLDAALRLEAGNLVAVPGVPGSAVDIDGALQKLAADPRGAMTGGYLTVEMKAVPPRIDDVSEAMSQAQRLLDTPVTLQAYDPIANEHFEWQVGREMVAAWLKIESTEAGVKVAVDQDRVAEYLQELSGGLGPERAIDAAGHSEPLADRLGEGAALTMTIDYRPTSYTIQPGDTLIRISWEVGIPYWMILQANPGLDQDRLLAGQELVIPAKSELLPLPAVENKRVVIDIGGQRLRVFEDGREIAEHVISTGIDRSPTQPGVFQIQTHEINAYASVWDLHMPHFLGIYEAWPGFMNGIHGLPTLSSGRRLWAGVLGRPVSYGCIVMELEAAEWLYDWAENGVVVEIQP